MTTEHEELKELRRLSRATDAYLHDLLRTTVTPYPLALERAEADERITRLTRERDGAREAMHAALGRADYHESRATAAEARVRLLHEQMGHLAMRVKELEGALREMQEPTGLPTFEALQAVRERARTLLTPTAPAPRDCSDCPGDGLTAAHGDCPTCTPTNLDGRGEVGRGE